MTDEVVVVVLALVFYLLSAWMTAAAEFASWQASYPKNSKRADDYYQEDLQWSWFVGVIPVIGPIVTLIHTHCYKHGINWRFRRLSVIQAERDKLTEAASFKPWWREPWR